MSRPHRLRLALLPAAAVYGLAAVTVARQNGRGRRMPAARAGPQSSSSRPAGASSRPVLRSGSSVRGSRPGRSPSLPVSPGSLRLGRLGGRARARPQHRHARRRPLARAPRARRSRFPHGRLQSLPARLLLAAVYVETVVVDVGRALFRDPFDDVNCWSNCTVNSFLVHRLRASRAHSAGSTCASRSPSPPPSSRWRCGASPRRPRRRGACSRRSLPRAPRSPFSTPPTRWRCSHRRSRIRATQPFAALFVGQSLAVSSVAVALGWTLVRAADVLAGRSSGSPSSWRSFRSRARSKRLSLGRPATRPLGSSIAPRRRSLCRRPGSRPFQRRHRPPERAVTPIVRDGRPLALLEHDPAALDDTFRDEIGSAARLAVENERLQAETLAQLIELRESRARIVAGGRRRSPTARARPARRRAAAARRALLRAAARARESSVRHRTAASPSRSRTPSEHSPRRWPLCARSRTVSSRPPSRAQGSRTPSRSWPSSRRSGSTSRRLPDRRLPDAVEAAAYGVIREAVENAALHAEAERVSISASVARTPSSSRRRTTGSAAPTLRGASACATLPTASARSAGGFRSRARPAAARASRRRSRARSRSPTT